MVLPYNVLSYIKLLRGGWKGFWHLTFWAFFLTFWHTWKILWHKLTANFYVFWHFVYLVWHFDMKNKVLTAKSEKEQMTYYQFIPNKWYVISLFQRAIEQFCFYTVSSIMKRQGVWWLAFLPTNSDNLAFLPGPTQRFVACTYLVLTFVGTYFRGDRNGCISRVHTFADLPSKCCKNPQNCLKMTEFSKITFFAGANFANFVKIRQKLIPA